MKKGKTRLENKNHVFARPLLGGRIAKGSRVERLNRVILGRDRPAASSGQYTRNAFEMQKLRDAR